MGKNSNQWRCNESFMRTLFFSLVYFLLIHSSPRVNLSEIAAILTLFASFIYLLGFFGIGFVQSLLIPSEDIKDDEDKINDYGCLIVKDDSRPIPCAAAPQFDVLKIASPRPAAKKIEITDTTKMETIDEVDEEIVKSVVEGKIPSYALESKPVDCRRAAAIRREALQRTTRKSLEGLSMEKFDYESI